MIDVETLKSRGIELYEKAEAFQKWLNDQLIGKRIRIDCTYYNGQLYGASKPKLGGREFIIDYATWQPYSGKITVGFRSHDASISIDRITFLE